MIDLELFDEYGENKGGLWYYTQNKFGSKWFNLVDNKKGWTVDFNLKVLDVQNSEQLVNENNKGKGIGVYVNDGKRQETINFLTQEIIFSNANQSIIYDTTAETDYRLIGKENNLKLYAQSSGESYYREVSNINFSTKATLNGNGLKPSIFEDANGILHVVWWDDGGNVGSLFYSKFEEDVWSEPEEIIISNEGAQFPSVIVDNNNIIYVVFELKRTIGSVIGLVYKNNIGWSDIYYTGQDIGYCRSPKLIFDSQSNVCVVWEDSRKTYPEIYVDIFLKNELKWRGEEQISDNIFGSYHPSIASYMDDLFISWTKKEENNISSIEIIKYNAISSQKSSIVNLCNKYNKADYSAILANISGKIFVVWHDNVSGEYKIYGIVLSPLLDILIGSSDIVDGNGGAMYPVLSEQITTGDVYIVWHDFKDGDYKEFIPFDDSPSVDDQSINPYYSAPIQNIKPLNSAIFVAGNRGGTFLSSGTGSFDVMLSFKDDRNAYNPAVPVFFNGELPIVYESYLVDEYGFILDINKLLRIKCAFYNLDRDNNIFSVSYGEGIDGYGVDRDYTLNKNISTKEIRFGDFSDVLNVHYIFKDFKYYLEDAVEPYSIKEIGVNTRNVDVLSSYDAIINNYGDVWIVGPCGIIYYINSRKNILKIGPEEDILGLINWTGESSVEIEKLKKFRVFAFDIYNNIFIGGENRLCRYSDNHFRGFNELELEGISSTATITSIVFNKDNNMFVGTDFGLYLYKLTYAEDDGDVGDTGVSTLLITVSLQTLTNNPTNNPTNYITSLKVDENNCLWIGTINNGLYRFYKDKFLNFTTVHGLTSNIVNDIAVRNTAIRYVATSNGINKMVGFNFDNTISSKDESIWNNNVKSVMWKSPNILFAGTMSRINQIIINDDDDTYSTIFYEPASSMNISEDDFKIYYIVNDIDIFSTDIVEVYINGNLIHYGYDIGYDNRSIRFRMSLNNDDIVEVIVRSDLEEIATFTQTQIEKNNIGEKTIKIKDFAVAGSDIYVVTEGDENEVKINDSNSILPFDRVHLDTRSPDFTTEGVGIKIGEQIDRSIVKVTIKGATDNFIDSSTGNLIEGSGVDRMIISNYDNFTTNGIISQESVPFSNSVNHDLGIFLDDIMREFDFDEGKGSTINYISSENELYAAISNPAIVYKYNWENEIWESLYTYDADQYVDFIAKYNEKLIISVGHDTSNAQLHIYNYTTSGLIASIILTISESRAYDFNELDGKFYIGSGIGGGDEYGSRSGVGGTIYLFDDGTTQNIDPSLSKVVEEIDENIYSITHRDGSSNLLAATGPNSYIYEIDIENKAAFIIYNSSESLISISYLNTNDLIFVGGDTDGIIRRSSGNNNTYDISFRTIPSKINVIKTFLVITTTENYLSAYAAVGNVIYYLSKSGVWVWRYTHNENINDITFNNFNNNNTLYVISDSNITKIKPLLEQKNIYLKLIDRAGNESVLDKSLPADTNKFKDSIDISLLADFINENKIFELDELGNVTYTLRGDSKFYSANKIEEERGEYLSEIFNGSNDLVKWESISWQATELFNTQVLIYVRTSTSQNDILITDWVGPYYTYQSAGVDIGAFSGQFIQFKAVLISNEKGITPSFHRVSIRVLTTEAVHFFTTNFALSSKMNKGILTSQKVLPVAADIIFGINTTNSIDWTEYQPVDENRIFNVNQIGKNLRVGIKFISPTRSLIEPSEFGEYGPYDSDLFVNTIDFSFTNNTGVVNNYHFKITLYENMDLNIPIFSAYSFDSSDGFSVNGSMIPEEGVEIIQNESVDVLFTTPGSANISCETYYFVKVEYIYAVNFELFSDDHSFIASCTASFIDIINFDFTNNEINSNYYHFRIKFYQDLERTSEYKTVFSGNDRNGWFINDSQIPEEGTLVSAGETIDVVYRVNPDDFSVGSIYYLVIEAHDGTNYVFASNSYTFQVRDVETLEYCGEYIDVPIVKNFGVMVELDSNEFVTLNI